MRCDWIQEWWYLSFLLHLLSLSSSFFPLFHSSLVRPSILKVQVMKSFHVVIFGSNNLISHLVSVYLNLLQGNFWIQHALPGISNWAITGCSSNTIVPVQFLFKKAYCCPTQHFLEMLLSPRSSKTASVSNSRSDIEYSYLSSHIL